MSELIAIVYPNEAHARDVVSSLRQMQEAHLVELDDVCYVTKDEGGRIELHQSINTTARGAVGGAFWGSLIGLLFLNPLIGMAAGAATGALAGRLTDVGISDDFMRSLTKEMEPGRSALFLLVRRATADKFSAELARHGGRVLHSSLSHDAEQRLRAALEDPAAGVSPLAGLSERQPRANVT
jgi:uncharacterized membrane protein